MLSVRLQRVGRKNDPSYRMVIIDSKRSVKSADYVENVGTYNPRQKGNTKINGERIKHWISVGAKPTDTVHNLLISQKIIEGKKVNPLGKKTPIVKEKEEVADEAPKEEVKDEVLDEAEAPKEDAAEEAEAPAKEETKDEPASEPEEKPKEEDSEASEGASEKDAEDSASTEGAKEEDKKDDDKKEA